MSTAEEEGKPGFAKGGLAQRVEDASLLLKYAQDKGVAVEPATASAVRLMQSMPREVSRFDEKGLPPSSGEDGPQDSPDFLSHVASLDDAIADLARILDPVTAETLKATDNNYGRRFMSISPWKLRSEAEIWSFKMWMYTGFALIVAGGTELMQEILYNWYPLDPDHGRSTVYYWHLTLVGMEKLYPFAYGLLGACLALLPKCHQFVSNRTFDPLRIAEYKSRMLLGFASGGIVMFFVHEINVGTGDELVQLGAPVLAIIAGYNTDFIFQAIERMVAAILPKVGISSARKAEPVKAGVHTVSIQALTKSLLEAQNEEDKKVIRQLLETARRNL